MISCTAECNPQSDELQYELCCNPANFGELVRVVKSNILRGYIVCPETIPDWCEEQ